MIWTRRLMRTAFIFLVTMTMLENESESNIRTVWILLDSGGPKSWADTLKSDGPRLYAGTENGVYISLDNGYTSRSTNLNHWITTIAISEDAVYAAEGSSGVFRSDNHGDTWNPKNNGLHETNDETIKTGEIRIPHIRQILPTRSGMIIAVGYHSGTYISNDRGETWHNPFGEWMYPGPKGPTVPDWSFSDSIFSMTEFDGYWWAVLSSGSTDVLRSHNNGDTWEYVGGLATLYLRWFGQVRDWTVLDDRLYVAGHEGIGRWNEAELTWEDLSQGLPPEGITSLAVNRGRLFTGLYEFGVYMFDKQSEKWFPAGLQEFHVTALGSHQSYLYAATGEPGAIYRASIPIVQPYGKAATTWGAVKRQ